MLATAVLSAPAAAELEPAPLGGWGVDDRVFATAVVGDTVIVGGRFRNAVSPTGQLVKRDRLAAFDRTTGKLLTDWRADAGGTVRALEVDGTDVYVGGWFGRVGGESRRRVAKIDGATGAVDPAFHPTPDNGVLAITADSTSVYIGGRFSSVDGVARRYLARLDKSTGAVLTGFNASMNGPVLGLAKADGHPSVFASGRFTSAGGASRLGVAGFDAGSGALRPAVFEGAARPTKGVAVNEDGTRLYGAVGAGANAAMAWDSASGNRLWRIRVMGDTQAIDYHAGVVYFGFHEGYQNDTTLKLLAADAATGALTDFRPSINSFWGVFAIAATDAGLAIGGDFTQVDGVSAPHFAWFPDSAA